MYKADIVIFDYTMLHHLSYLQELIQLLNAHLRNGQVLPLKFRVPH